METVLENETHMIEIKEIVHNASLKESVLRLNYSETASGYYWCTVITTQPGQETLYPSHVININISGFCPFPGNPSKMESNNVCSTQVDLFENSMMERCADVTPNIDDIIYIQEEQLGSIEMCAIENHGKDFEESTTTGEIFPPSTTNSNSGFPMRYVWMTVGIAFGSLIIAIIEIVALSNLGIWQLCRSH
jgi:hypothetical protein